MTYDDMISVIQAAKDGKAIQFKSRHGACTNWCDAVGNLAWNFEDYSYRVKPEPLKALHRFEPKTRVVKIDDDRAVKRGVFLATEYDDALLVHADGGPFWVGSRHDTRLTYLTRSECEAAGYEWPVCEEESQ